MLVYQHQEIHHQLIRLLQAIYLRALFDVLSENFENDVPDRFTLFFYDKAKKVSISIENCLLTDDPEQMNYNDTFYQTTMTFQCFK